MNIIGINFKWSEIVTVILASMYRSWRKMWEYPTTAGPPWAAETAVIPWDEAVRCLNCSGGVPYDSSVITASFQGGKSDLQNSSLVGWHESSARFSLPNAAVLRRMRSCSAPCP